MGIDITPLYIGDMTRHLELCGSLDALFESVTMPRPGPTP